MAKTTIDFSDAAIGQLDRLADTLQVTKSEILRNALSLYAYIVYQLNGEPDKVLGIVNDKDGTVEKRMAVPGVQMANSNGRTAS